MAAPSNNHTDLTKGVRYRRSSGLAKAIRIIGSSNVISMTWLTCDSYLTWLTGYPWLTRLTRLSMMSVIDVVDRRSVTLKDSDSLCEPSYLRAFLWPNRSGASMIPRTHRSRSGRPFSNSSFPSFFNVSFMYSRSFRELALMNPYTDCLNTYIRY